MVLVEKLANFYFENSKLTFILAEAKQKKRHD